MYSDADTAALYDAMYSWDPEAWPGDGFYNEFVMAASAVLDVGCGTGSMLHSARENGHTGRLVGLEPDRPSLDRARRRTDIEWVEGVAADAGARWQSEFELATMTGHAFQCLVGDDVVAASLASVRETLRPGGRFVFETRHPQVRAWETWNPSNESAVVDAAGRSVRIWNEVEEVVDDLVSVSETIAEEDGTVLRVDRETLRFLDVARLDAFLAEAGFEIEARYGDWKLGPITAESREIITVARRP